LSSKKGLYNRKSLLKRMIQVIKENQFRIFMVLFMLGYIIFLLWFVIVVNPNPSLSGFFKNPLNWIIVIFGGITLWKVFPLIREVWEQTYIRDNITKQTAIKLELENIKLMKNLGLKFNKDKLSKEIKNLLKEEDLICPIDNLKCPVAELGKEINN